MASWLNEVLCAMASAMPPVLVHCRSGKDRTGVVVAAALMVTGLVPRDVIVSEYMASAGKGLKPELLDILLNGKQKWRRGLDEAKLRAMLCTPDRETEIYDYLRDRRQWLAATARALTTFIGPEGTQNEDEDETQTSLCRTLVAFCACETTAANNPNNSNNSADKNPSVLVTQAWAEAQLGRHTDAKLLFDAAAAMLKPGDLRVAAIEKQRAKCLPK